MTLSDTSCVLFLIFFYKPVVFQSSFYQKKEKKEKNVESPVAVKTIGNKRMAT